MVLSLIGVTACGADGPKAPTQIEVVKPTGTAAFDRTFSWRAVEGATSYRVVVFNSNNERTFEVHDVRGTSVAIAKSVVLIPGPYSWQVVAVRDGATMLESPVTTFEIK
jgi:3-dehydroquinate dehydratase